MSPFIHTYVFRKESLKSVDGKRLRHRDWLSSSGSSSSLSGTSDGDHASIGGRGTNVPERGSTVMERPARWTSKVWVPPA